MTDSSGTTEDGAPAGTRGSLQPPPGATMLPRMELTARDRDILDFESSWWAESGPKEQLIRDRFELSATRYYLSLIHI